MKIKKPLECPPTAFLKIGGPFVSGNSLQHMFFTIEEIYGEGVKKW
jgi:hypothetical protein